MIFARSYFENHFPLLYMSDENIHINTFFSHYTDFEFKYYKIKNEKIITLYDYELSNVENIVKNNENIVAFSRDSSGKVVLLIGSDNFSHEYVSEIQTDGNQIYSDETGIWVQKAIEKFNMNILKNFSVHIGKNLVTNNGKYSDKIMIQKNMTNEQLCDIALSDPKIISITNNGWVQYVSMISDSKNMPFARIVRSEDPRMILFIKKVKNTSSMVVQGTSISVSVSK
jgi:hypothetical protein